MNKKEWIWIVIRIFGLLLLTLAVVAIPEVITGAYSVSLYYEYSNLDATIETPGYEIAKKVLEAQIGQFIGAISKLLIYSVLGVYLTKNGKGLHSVLFREC